MKNLYAIWEEDGAFGVADGLAAAIGPISWAALLLAVFLPVLLIYCRNEIRTRRLRLIADFILSYPATRNKKSVSADATEAEATSNPSLELVTSKYLSDLGDPDYKLSKPNSVELVQEIERRIRSSRLFGNLGDYRLLIASIGFMILCYFGFLNLFAVVTRGFEVLTASGGRACDIAAVAGATCCATGSVHSQLQIVGSLAFAGAFIAATRQFVRSLAVFDLSAYTFVWQAVEIFASVIIVIFLYEAFEDPSKAVEGLMTGNAIARQCADVPWIWMALAPLLGLLPQSSTKFLLLKLQSLVAWVKMDDDRFNTVTRLTPLDVIDGIDYSIRFRLEECGIYDVQNLATYNPIALHIESPYGIYQTVDWVGQAQLCSIIGLDKFLLLRQMNIRTVFDLERALDYRAFDDRRSVMTDGPDEFDKIYAGILFAATGTMRKIGETSGLQPIVIRQAQLSDAPVVEAVSIEAYCAWACQTITASPERTKLCMEHLMGWIADDLHVRRLRRIWQEMSDDLGDRSKRMDSTYPARPPAPVPPVPAPQPPAPDPAP